MCIILFKQNNQKVDSQLMEKIVLQFTKILEVEKIQAAGENILYSASN